MSTAAAIMCLLIAIEFGVQLSNHGKPKPDYMNKYNVWVWLVATSVYVGLLTWGGFFKGIP